MAIKKTVVSEVATALGAAAARVENLAPKRSATSKHSKAKPAPVAAALHVSAPAKVQRPEMTELQETELVAYLYSEARGFQGGSQEEDWLRAEAEVRARRAARV